MKTIPCLARWSALLLLVFVVPLANAQPTITTFARLGGTPDGSHPMTALLAGGDGAYYGVTEAGGPANCGTVYKITADGTLTTIYAFGGTDGANPKAALVNGGDGFFYGTTNGGGANGTGTIFKVSAAGDFTSLHSFSAVNATSNNYNDEGAFPLAALVPGGDGFLYGTTAYGGTAGDGTIFRVTPGGAFNVVHALANATEGTTPSFALTPGGDGNLYGTTRYGGTGSGVFFRVSPAGVYQVVSTFPSGNNPASELFLSGGVFYGLAQGSYGVSSGIFYSVTPAGVVTILHNFAGTEGNVSFGGPTYASGLSIGADGNFYVSTPTGGANNAGAILQLTPAGALTTLHALTSNDGSSYPSGAPILGSDGNLYGAIAGFNTLSIGAGGSIYQVTPAGVLTTLHSFQVGGYFTTGGLLQYSDGNFYGVTKQGGAYSGGTIFGVAGDGSSNATIFDFNPDVTGGFPEGELHLDANGNIDVAATSDGPTGAGALLGFSVVASAPVPQARKLGTPHPKFSHASYFGLSLIFQANMPKSVGLHFHELYSLIGAEPTPAKSGRPTTRAIAGTASFVGILQAGGDGNGGAICAVAPDSTVTSLHEFGVTDNDGKLPEGLVVGTDGALYGTTYGGGTVGAGTVFKVATDGTYSTLYSFQGTGDGASPAAGLTLGADGNLYGTTVATTYSAGSGQQGGNGTIFRVTPDGTFTTLHVFASDAYAEGTQPMAALLQASDGKLYGTTSSAGPGGGYGTVFSITTGGTFATVGGFDDLRGNGALPEGPLIEAADGNLYGTTTAGGTDGAGVIYEVVLNPTTTSTLPAVTLTATTPSVTAGSGGVGVFTLTLPAAQANDLHVNLEIKGTAINGTDYTLLNTSKKIKAGKTSKAIKIKPQGDLGGVKKTVKLTLAPGDGYTVGTTDKVKVKILPATP